LWDYNAEEVDTDSKLVRKLRKRFDGATQAEKCRGEAKCRRRKPGESLRALHSDFCRLTALAFPKLEDQSREFMACDYFINVLDDPARELKITEKVSCRLNATCRPVDGTSMNEDCEAVIVVNSGLTAKSAQ